MCCIFSSCSRIIVCNTGDTKRAIPQYDLNSKRVSKLSKDSTAEEVLKATKRAQNLHDVHDIRTVERFLLEEAPKSFAFGYVGSLLSRLAVAALHLNEQQVARRALLRRRQDYSSSVLPMESAAIIRGLLRVHNATDAFQVLNEELGLPPLDTIVITSDENKERVKHRALSHPHHASLIIPFPHDTLHV